MITVEAISSRVLPKIAELEVDLFETALKLPALQNLFDGTAFVGYISLEKRKICGYLLAQRALDHVEILSLGTAQTYQRRGHASELLAMLINDSCDSKLFLEVATDNKAALDLYRKNGFAEVGRRSGYYRRGCEVYDALVMRRG